MNHTTADLRSNVYEKLYALSLYQDFREQKDKFKIVNTEIANIENTTVENKNESKKRKIQ